MLGMGLAGAARPRWCWGRASLMLRILAGAAYRSTGWFQFTYLLVLGWEIFRKGPG